MIPIWKFASDDPVRALAERHAFTKALESYAGDSVDGFAAALVFAELVGNVARHAPGPIEISLVVDGSLAVLTVTDRGPGFELNPALPPPLSEGGRGMYLVSLFASGISVGREDDTGHFVRAIFRRR